MMHSHTIKNFLLTTGNFTVANTILGPDLISLKEKTVRTTPSLVVHNYSAVPASIYQLHHHVTIAVDIMYVKYLVFLVIVSRRLKFTTSMFMKSKKVPANNWYN